MVSDGRTFPASVLIDGSRVQAVLPEGEEQAYAHVPRVDLHGGYVAPGYIDLLLHGLYGIDCLNGRYDELSAKLLPHGTTGFLAGLRSSPLEMIRQALLAVGKAMAADPPAGARMLGAHIEGIYFAPEWCGAQAAHTLRRPDAGEALALAALGGGALKVMSVSPELPGVLDVIEALVQRGVRVSLGHTGATPAQLDAAIQAGASLFTHLYNATGGPTYREPGVRTRDTSLAVLTRPELTATLICDGVHVEPDLVRLTVAAKGAHGVALITDAMTAGGLPDGVYPTADGRNVVIRAGTARLENGDLFGSVLTMDVAVRNVVRWGIALPDAIAMASTVPARVLGLGHRKGRVAAGYDADLVLLDGQLRVLGTVVGGRLLYAAEGLDGSGDHA